MQENRKKILFIDRDGTLILEPADYQIDSFEKLTFYPGVLAYLPRIAKELDFELVMKGLNNTYMDSKKFS